jgi:hypothetical protein
MKDFAPETGRNKVKGFRTKSAKRRAQRRTEAHIRRQAEASRNARRHRKAQRARIREGWWPPVYSD